MPEILPRTTLETVRKLRDVVDEVLEVIEGDTDDIRLDINTTPNSFNVGCEWTSDIAPELVRKFVQVALNPTMTWQLLLDLETMLAAERRAQEMAKPVSSLGEVPDADRS